MSHSAVCWQCGASLAALSLPFSRFDTCRTCGAAVHACRQCRFYAPTFAKQCAEPVAEDERDKQRNNACDYFSPCMGAFATPTDTDTRAQLAALFGGQTVVAASAPVAPDLVQQKADATAKARQALDDLFGKKS